MKDYSLMSDFDINHSVLSSMKIDGRVFDKPHFADGSSVGIHYDIGDRYEWFDYCNNPSDAWPVIHENRISLRPDDMYEEAPHSGYWRADNEAGNHCHHENPLRAAIIVYLMMKDEEK